MRLARMHNEHDWYLRIQLNRSHPDYEDALAYLTQLACNLPIDEVVPYIIRYGRRILEHKVELANLLTRLCTGESPDISLYSPTADAVASVHEGIDDQPPPTHPSPTPPPS